MLYDCVIIGGGIAGTQAAIQLGRYSAHKVLVIDSGYGRSSICHTYHNILGWDEGVTGEYLRKTGRKQAEALGAEFLQDTVTEAARDGESFVLTTGTGKRFAAHTVLIATGMVDRYPTIPGLRDTLGYSVYICPDCDGYEIVGRRTVLLGSGEEGSGMAVLLSERTPHLTYVNHEKAPIDEKLLLHLRKLGVDYEEQPAAEVRSDGSGNIEAVVLEDGRVLEAERGFIAFGGNHVRTELAGQLGVTLESNLHIKTDPRTKMTDVEGVWAAGDISLHSELTAIAMGDGMQAAVWIHKRLRKIDNSG
ncbi:NAD(P)/FAD-dependent oxidoreductase [Saccharibacillus sp. CPCC 101409]|uniref:NAD(P)/FAD-dependent oxidoreductase n=1 Tax=Saccharibacillus sp. CPCC 101409 TaxID=3058041 RepID=UPI002673FF4F|nr:NAD(P)/FAD-dependent oxidoreductase [Saccharibacillus sp. CPCC 101409]MDO3411707.1 NAD(P)/FAD-dependent oxidoreductase [Saccharibacillus sp. CPCC 101409]